MHRPHAVTVEVNIKDNRAEKGFRTETRTVHISARNQANAERAALKRFPGCKVVEE
jgi:hypothetical protein